jgi:hypothetical protein
MKRDRGTGPFWTVDEVQGWFVGRVPDGWFTGPPTVRVDREEILVVGELPVPDTGSERPDEAVAAALASRIRGFREETRERRMRIAAEVEAMWGRKVSWGARCGEREELFTTQSVPVMTRLRMQERAVLDTLIDAGVARSRSEALAWCVRLVGTNQAEWIDQLRDAMARVEQVRADGPELA